MLADFAEVMNGKLYIMGGGWSITGPSPVPSAIAVKIIAPWSPADRKHNLTLQLLDSAGKQVVIKSDDGKDQPVVLGGSFLAEQSTHIKEGTPLDFPYAVNLPPLPLEPGMQYTWKLSMDGKTQDEWQISFNVRPLPTIKEK
jgi:hypothetical protein